MHPSRSDGCQEYTEEMVKGITALQALFRGWWTRRVVNFSHTTFTVEGKLLHNIDLLRIGLGLRHGSS